MNTNYLFTSESVTEGHPDKVADHISDALLDLFVEADPYARTAIEVSVTTDFVLVMGEVSSTVEVTNEAMEKVIRNTIINIGYDSDDIGFNGNTCEIINRIHQQSSDIAMGVAQDDGVIGAGDQGMMFGYATDECNNYMPLPITLAHIITHNLMELRKGGVLDYLRPDGKAQVTVEYDEDDNPLRIDTIVISTQHNDTVSQETIKKDLTELIVNTTLPQEMIDEHTHIFINPTGRFVIGGPNGDSGLTGRKIIVDTYGGMARHGGGAFSGKDCTKVDRSGAYAARYVAKNIVANGLADKCEIQLSYAIGVARPISIMVDTFGTEHVTNKEIIDVIERNFDLTPSGIIKMLNLRQPIYHLTSGYGHFGKEELPWEQVIDLEV